MKEALEYLDVRTSIRKQYLEIKGIQIVSISIAYAHEKNLFQIRLQLQNILHE